MKRSILKILVIIIALSMSGGAWAEDEYDQPDQDVNTTNSSYTYCTNDSVYQCFQCYTTDSGTQCNLVYSRATDYSYYAPYYYPYYFFGHRHENEHEEHENEQHENENMGVSPPHPLTPPHGMGAQPAAPTHK